MTKHPLAVKPETVARFIPRHLRYALTAEEVANAIRDGRITPAVETKGLVDPKRRARDKAWNEKRKAAYWRKVDSARLSEGDVSPSGNSTADK